MRWRFVGTESEIGHVRINQFGTILELDEETSHDAILGRVGLVTEDDWNKAGITEEEETVYAEPRSHGGASPEFKRKKAKLHSAAVSNHIDYCKRAESGQTFMSMARRTTESPASFVHIEEPSSHDENI